MGQAIVSDGILITGEKKGIISISTKKWTHLSAVQGVLEIFQWGKDIFSPYITLQISGTARMPQDA